MARATAIVWRQEALFPQSREVESTLYAPDKTKPKQWIEQKPVPYFKGKLALIFAVSVGVLAVLSYTVFASGQDPVPVPPAPRFTVGYINIFGEPENFWIRTNNGLCSSDIAALLAVTNSQQITTMIARMDYQILDDDGRWQDLDTLGHDGQLYAGVKKKMAAMNVLSGGFLDDKIIGQNIAGGTTESGFILWNRTNQRTPYKLQFRVKITEINGQQSLIEINRIDAPNQGLVLSYLSGPEDLSALKDASCSQWK